MRILATADLHWGIGVGEEDVRRLAQEVCSDGAAADVLLIAGDVAEERRWSECFALFNGFSGMKIACAGNHDIWDKNFWDEAYPTRESGPSLHIYEELWPAACASAGWHCLDTGPIVINGTGFVGGMAWYDYTFRNKSLGWPLSAYERKIVPGDWSPVTNDVEYVKLGMDDVQFTDQMVQRISAQIRAIQSDCERVVAITHHPCFKQMLVGSEEMWTAISGSARIGELFLACEKTHLYVAGHTHERGPRQIQIGQIACLNPHSTYTQKNLLWLDPRRPCG